LASGRKYSGKGIDGEGGGQLGHQERHTRLIGRLKGRTGNSFCFARWTNCFRLADEEEVYIDSH
jgi:hypothetical protein